MTPDLFRTLSPTEEAEFRSWAHRNPRGLCTIDPLIIHPVIRNEWEQMEKPSVPLSVHSILNDPSASNWLKDSLRSALNRDIVDAANDASILSSVLSHLSTLANRQE